MQIGDQIPRFNLPTLSDQSLSNDDLSGSWSVIYFYPKDNTPGCTKEAIAFSENIEEFKSLGARVIGVSADSPKKHENFINKHDLSVELISDEDKSLCEAFGVWVEKKLYGKVHMGIERATFLFDPTGTLKDVWRKVKVTGHAEDVLSALRKQIELTN